MQMDLFEPGEREEEALGPGAVVLRGFALSVEEPLLAALDEVIERAPLRHMTTPGGFRMSVAMTNCGALGWVSDERGYRYDPIDPERAAPWPAMPEAFARLATRAAEQAGHPGFEPDACLVNRYAIGARLTLHQDKNERDFRQPIVSVSLGLPARFLFGGARCSDPPARARLVHGDVAVWGGPARPRYHGALPLAGGRQPRLGPLRIDLAFRETG